MAGGARPDLDGLRHGGHNRDRHGRQPARPKLGLTQLGREAGIARLSSHSGRHTAISGQLRAGVPLLDVGAARAGHRDDTVTAQAYCTILLDKLCAGGFNLEGFRVPSLAEVMQIISALLDMAFGPQMLKLKEVTHRQEM